MIEPGAHIETGIDRLMDILGDVDKLELDEAVNILKVSKDTVQQWVDFLEEEGLIDVEFSLTKTFLMKKQLTEKQVKEKKKSYGKKRDAFVSRVDAALKQLEHERKIFDKVKKKYAGLQDDLGVNLQNVEDEIKELHNYEELKKSFEEQAKKQKETYKTQISKIDKELGQEEKRYDKVVDDITGEIVALKRETTNVKELEQEEDLLETRIKALQELVNEIVGKLNNQAKHIDEHKNRLTQLEKLAKNLQRNIKGKKEKEIEPMMSIAHDQEKKILRIQDEVVQKVKNQVEKMDEYRHKSEDVAQKFYEFFERRAKTDALLSKLTQEEQDMEKDLQDLVYKAKAYDITHKDADVTGHVAELEDKLKKYQLEKQRFHNEFGEVQHLISSEEDSAEKLAAKA